MAVQSYSNHGKLDRKRHGILFLFWIFSSIIIYRGIFWYIVPMITKGAGVGIRRRLFVILLCLWPIVMCVLLLTIRWYALTLQDRIIRVEESIRHVSLWIGASYKALTIQQIIALRFASDEELPSLVQQAVTQKLSPKEIKQSIKERKADHHRV